MKRLKLVGWLGGLIFLIFPVTFEAAGRENYIIQPVEFSNPPKIDGILENPLWEKATVIEQFTQYEPQEGAKPSELTRVFIGYDQNYLYIAFRCFDSDPQAIRASLTQRDRVMRDDGITVYLDTFNDKKRAFVFQVNPCGIQNDGIFVEGGRRGRGRGGGGGGGMMGFERFDRSWDGYFLSEAKIDDQGYTVEMAIPFKTLRFPNTGNQKWGLIIQRSIRRKNEELYWPPQSRNINGFLIQAGQLEFPSSISTGKNIEVMPVITALRTDVQKFSPQPGVNFKWGLSSDLTADFTLNPDYSQIEADMPQIDVNQRYALYYPEKRPFFIEGRDYFDTFLEVLYPRRIIDPIWGLKLSGKTKGTALGILSVLDSNPVAIKIPNKKIESIEGTSARAWINVFRLRQDIYSESYLGFLFCDKEIGPSFSQIFSDYNRVAGLDGHFKIMGNNRLSFQLLGAKTKVEGQVTRIVPALALNFNRQTRHVNFSLDYNSLPPDFEAASGFFRRLDIKSFNTRFGYVFLPEKEYIISIRPSIEYRRIYDFNNTLTDNEVDISLFLSGWRQSSLWFSFSTGLERYRNIDFYKSEFDCHFNTEPFSWLSANISYGIGEAIYYSSKPYLGFRTSWSLRTSIRPKSNLSFFYNLQNNEFYRERGGERVYKINIISQRINYQLSKSVSLRLITEYNDYYDRFFVSFLFSYEYRPGTVFYFGVDKQQGRDERGIFQRPGPSVFVKFSYWWRL
ncbi:MAG: carbohydrate binding family 9 domain-containing protein [Candidatus Aminicenantes bacterium]|nr:carbohydrate binding family 9 domain-containing protein [Candidatus Aminicenantes bacterium]